MLKFRFAHRVAVYRGFAVIYKSPAAAAHLLDSGLATVRKRASRTVIELELTGAAVGYVQGQVPPYSLGLHAGSFGIRVQNFESGLFCFEHRNPWDEVRPPVN